MGLSQITVSFPSSSQGEWRNKADGMIGKNGGDVKV